MMDLHQITTFFRAACECSIYLRPREPGLTPAELREVGEKQGLLPGEIGDALVQLGGVTVGRSARILPNIQVLMLDVYGIPRNPDYRNLKAFDFVYTELNTAIRTHGLARAKISRAELMSRALTQSLALPDVEVAIAVLLLTKAIVEDDQGVLQSKLTGVYQPLPSDQQASASLRQNPRFNLQRERAYETVKEVIAESLPVGVTSGATPQTAPAASSSSVLPPQSSAPRSAVPAADRFVRFDHNSAPFKEAEAALERLSEAIRGSNELFANPDERIAVADEVGYIRKLISGASVRLSAVQQATEGSLKWLAKEVASSVVRTLAAAAVTALIALAATVLLR